LLSVFCLYISFCVHLLLSLPQLRYSAPLAVNFPSPPPLPSNIMSSPLGSPDQRYEFEAPQFLDFTSGVNDDNDGADIWFGTFCMCVCVCVHDESRETSTASAVVTADVRSTMLSLVCFSLPRLFLSLLVSFFLFSFTLSFLCLYPNFYSNT
jgi:hypothetical protein